MSDHLSLLCELDPEHFRQSGGHMWWRKTSKEKFLLLIDGITWEIAGWMLQIMQDALKAAEGTERVLLEDLLSKPLLTTTPDSITEWYKGWKAFTRSSDAPAASAQELRPQAPAITHETDH